MAQQQSKGLDFPIIGKSSPFLFTNYTLQAKVALIQQFWIIVT
jgi:hypothetical protein